MGVIIKEFEISSLDKYFAGFIAAFAAGNAEVYRAAALVSMATRNGHSCLELREWAGNNVPTVSGQVWELPGLARWQGILTGCAAIGSGSANTPLVMEDDRLYLRRYWGYEEEVARGLLRRGRAASLSVDAGRLMAGLARCFPPGSDDGGQRLAVLVAMLRPLAVITGGPGTGKTTTVALLLSLLAGQCPEHGGSPRVALAAPTGKAAVRLQESISKINELRFFPAQMEGTPLPGQVMTLHRLLGAVGGSSFFRYNEENPLPYDLVVVDEASMVDLPLMAKLLRALKPETRLVLLGDRHQLASVEPGSVLGDLCAPAALASFSREFRGRLSDFGVSIAPGPSSGEISGLEDSLVELQRVHRFARESGIARLGTAVKSGDPAAVRAVLDDPAAADVVWREVDSPTVLNGVLPEVAKEFADWSAMTPGEALVASGRFRVLCAVRHGAFGAEQVNARIAEFVVARGHGVVPGSNYPGRPVMVLRNDYDLRLYNGDTGVMLADPDEAGELRAFLPAPEGGIRKLSPARLPVHQTVYAMTVHKSQGSEFSKILLILPEHPSLVLSRELLFTAITRARTRVEIWGRRQILEQAVLGSSERHSGLHRKLWGA